MAAVVRTVVYLAIILGLLAVFLPTETFDRSAAPPGAARGLGQVAGATLTLAGAGLALWCALTFAVLGRGTPLPFDPPQRLVVAGPYRWVRNPMAIGAGSALVGVAIFYQSLSFLLFAGVFMLGIHAFVVLYEEPTLRRTFDAEYVAYCAKVDRWLPHPPRSNPAA